MSSTAVEIPGYVAGTYTIDPGHSDVVFTVRHLMVSKVRGHSEDGFDLDGELSLHGVTRPVTLALDVNGFTRDPYGGTRAGFSATTELDRGEFGMSTNLPMDSGGVVIGDRLQVFLELEAVLTHPSQPLARTTDLQEGTFDGGQARRRSAAARERCDRAPCRRQPGAVAL